jgi:hypothetical protein
MWDDRSFDTRSFDRRSWFFRLVERARRVAHHIHVRTAQAVTFVYAYATDLVVKRRG